MGEPQRLTPSPPGRVLSGLGCGSCGGTLSVREGETNLVCTWCGTPQLVLGERGTSRVMVLDRIDRAGAERRLRVWLDDGMKKHSALTAEATVSEAFLAYFPFVRARVDLVGWCLGVDRKRVKRGNTWKTIEVPKEVQIERAVDVTNTAADMAEFGVATVDLGGDEVVPLDEELLSRRGMVFRPSRSAAEAANEEIGRAMEEAERAHRLDRVTFASLRSVRRRVELVYYPLWVLRYDFRNRTYQVLVDAEDGSLAYGKAPGNDMWRAGSLIAACAGAAFVGTTVLQHLGVLLRSDAGLAMMAAVGLGVAGLVAWGYHQFRHGGVVEEGTGRRPQEPPNDDVEAIVRKLGG